MNRLTSQQRKLIYLAAIGVLVVPIIWLGAPATGEESSGGVLAQLRNEHDLGESTLGKVDPSSATMNLVLLGMRGLAANQLWLQHQEQKKTKNWAQMRATTESIITLQPHFLEVWRFHGWELAYNVSAQWDAVEDRYYWVKEGGKFYMRGTERNSRYPELFWETGRVLGQKIGRSDEWRFFRKFFRRDPNVERFKGRPDPEFNRGDRDNYLEAKQWFTKANQVEESQRQHIMMRLLFRHYPARSQLDYAGVLHREGIFDETTRIAWSDAFDDWTQKYGQEIFLTSAGKIRLEVDEDDIRQLVKEDDGKYSFEDKRETIRFYQNTANYRYWRTRAEIESKGEMVDAHRDIYQGQQAFKRGEVVYGPDGAPPQSIVLLERGMQGFETALEKFKEYRSQKSGDITTDDDLVEEILTAIVYWRYILQLNEKPVPDEFPLKDYWEKYQERIPTTVQRFKRENSL